MSIPSMRSFVPHCGRCLTPFHHEPVPGAITVGHTRPACDCPNPIYNPPHPPLT